MDIVAEATLPAAHAKSNRAFMFLGLFAGGFIAGSLINYDIGLPFCSCSLFAIIFRNCF